MPSPGGKVLGRGLGGGKNLRSKSRIAEQYIEGEAYIEAELYRYIPLGFDIPLDRYIPLGFDICFASEARRRMTRWGLGAWWRHRHLPRIGVLPAFLIRLALRRATFPPGEGTISGAGWRSEGCTANWVIARIPLPSALRAATFPPGEGIACGVF